MTDQLPRLGYLPASGMAVRADDLGRWHVVDYASDAGPVDPDDVVEYPAPEQDGPARGRGYDRALVDAAVRTGADVTAGEAAAILRERDELARAAAAAEQAERSRAVLSMRVARAAAILESADAEADPAAARARARDALHGEIR